MEGKMNYLGQSIPSREMSAIGAIIQDRFDHAADRALYYNMPKEEYLWAVRTVQQGLVQMLDLNMVPSGPITPSMIWQAISAEQSGDVDVVSLMSTAMPFVRMHPYEFGLTADIQSYTALHPVSLSPTALKIIAPEATTVSKTGTLATVAAGAAVLYFMTR
jgi:hypothetical protein